MKEGITMEEAEIYLSMVQENKEHARHIETERMWFANIFAAIIVGTTAYLSEVGLEIPPLILLVLFAGFCLLVTKKLNKAFGHHMKAIENIFNDGKLLPGENKNWRSYMGMPAQGGWVQENLQSVAKLTVYFYSIAIIVLCALIICIWCNVICTT